MSGTVLPPLLVSPGLQTLDGLGSLATIGGRLILVSNPALGSLRGLRKVTVLEGLVVHRNLALTSLAGLDSVTRINGDVVLTRTGLTSMQGLGGLECVTGDVRLDRNDNMPDFGGLDSLRRIGGSLVIGRPQLSSLRGLSTLEHIGGSLVIHSGSESEHSAPSFNFAGLEGLARIGGNLVISSIDNIESFDGFDSLEEIGGHLVFVSCIFLKRPSLPVSSQPPQPRTGAPARGGDGNVSPAEGTARVLAMAQLAASKAGERARCGETGHLCGLARLRRIGGDVHMDGNVGITTLDGLGGL